MSDLSSFPTGALPAGIVRQVAKQDIGPGRGSPEPEIGGLIDRLLDGYGSQRRVRERAGAESNRRNGIVDSSWKARANEKREEASYFRHKGDGWGARRWSPEAVSRRFNGYRKRGPYAISVVAERFDVHPQIPRLQEREGLLQPSRTEGDTLTYTDEEIDWLDVILPLTKDLGVNLGGVEINLRMCMKMDAVQRQMHDFSST